MSVVISMVSKGSIMNILTITVLLSVTHLMAFAASHRLSPTPKQSAQLSGTVQDMNESRVSGATITVEGKGLTQTVATSEDGTYKIELPVGTYRIKANRPGFCPAHRAPFRVLSSDSIILNFTLIPCPIVNELMIKNDRYVGERDRYKDPFKEEVFTVANPTGAPLELLVRYGSRQEDRNILEYRGTAVPYEHQAESAAGSVHREKYLGVTISYNLLAIRADKVRLDPITFRLEAEGNVVIEDGKRCVEGKRVVVDLKRDEPRVELTQ
jgi:hypothetical protein